jgi:hypothetical protein
MPFVASVEGQYAYGRQPQTQIVQANLQIWLDAANPSSYSSGATWSNLATSGATYNFSLVNTPTTSNVSYNGTTNTSLSFNGTNQYASPNTSLLTLAQANNWAETQEYWVFWRGSPGCLTMESGAATPDTSWFDAQAAMSNTFLAYSVWQGSVAMTPYVVFSAMTSNTWNHVVWQHNKGTNTMMAYVNGTQTYSNAAIARTTPDSVGAQFFTVLMAGSATNFGYGSGSYMNGALGIYRWYNQILTPAQVQQNFNAQRNRFGR